MLTKLGSISYFPLHYNISIAKKTEYVYTKSLKKGNLLQKFHKRRLFFYFNYDTFFD